MLHLCPPLLPLPSFLTLCLYSKGLSLFVPSSRQPSDVSHDVQTVVCLTTTRQAGSVWTDKTQTNGYVYFVRTARGEKDSSVVLLNMSL